MEAFTSGKISAAARRSYLTSHPGFPTDRFIPVRGGYRMFGWESQISMARACGRGAASGRARQPHPFDVIDPARSAAEKEPATA